MIHREVDVNWNATREGAARERIHLSGIFNKCEVQFLIIRDILKNLRVL